MSIEMLDDKEVNSDSTVRPVWQLPVSGSENRGNAYIHSSAKYHCFVDDASLCGRYFQGTSFYDGGITVESGYIAQNPNKACSRCYKRWKNIYMEKGD